MTPAALPPAPTGWGSWLLQRGSGLASGAASKASNLWQGTKSRLGRAKDVAVQSSKRGFEKVKNTAVAADQWGLARAEKTGDWIGSTIDSVVGTVGSVVSFGRHPVETLKKAVRETPPEHLVALKTALDEIIDHPNAVTQKNLFDLHTALSQISDEEWKSYIPHLIGEDFEKIHTLRDSCSPESVQHILALTAKDELVLSDDELSVPKQLQQAIGSIIDARTGIIDKAVDRLGDKVMHPKHGMLAQWIRTPELKLTDIQEGVILLQQLVEDNSPREKLLPITVTLKNLISGYSRKLPSSYLKYQLELLLRRLRRYNRTATAPSAPLKTPLKNALKALSAEITNETGPLIKAFEKVGDTVVEKLTRKAQETLPEVFGKPPSPFAPPAAAGTPPATASAASSSKTKPGMLGALLSYGLQQISSAIKSGVESLGDQGAQYIGIWLLPALQEGAKALEEKSMFKTQRKKLREIIAEISEEKTPGVKTLKNDLSLQKLWQLLKDNIECINSVDINIHGFDIPKLFSSAKTPDPKRLLIQNSHEAREAKNVRIDPNTTDESSWKQRAQIEKKLWVRNTTNFVVIKRIFEKACKFNPNNALYYQLMQGANQATDPKAKLKELFFTELQNRGVSGFQRAYLKVYYTIFWSFLNNILKDLTTNISKEVFQWIESNKNSEYTNFKSMLIENFTRYLGILGGSYKRVANDPKPYDKPSKMLIKDLADPELNDGYTTEALYTSFAQGLFSKYVKNWFNSALLKIAVGDGKELVQELINSGIKSLSDDYGYTHTLNTLLVEQLEQLIHTVRYEIASGKKLNPTPLNAALSEHKKLELQSLVKNLLEVLPMGKCNTHAELRTLLKGDSFRANMSTFKDSLFLDKVIENVSDGISVAMNMLLKKERLHEIMYKMTSSLNRIYVEGDSSTVEQREATQDRLSKLSSELLDLHIHSALDRYLSPPEENTSTPTKGYVKQLKKSTSLFTTQVQKHLKRLKDTNSKLTTEEAISIVDTLLDKADAYQENCITELQEIEQSELSKNNKNALKKRYEEAAKKSEPLIQALTDLKHSPHRLLHNKALKKQLKPLDKTLKTIENTLKRKKTQLEDSQEWILQLKESIAEISRLNIIDPSIEGLVEKTPVLRKTIKTLSEQHSLLTCCTSLTKMVSECEKEGKLMDPAPWLEAISSINNQKLKEKLSQIVKQIARASNGQAFKKAIDEYKRALETTHEETLADLKKTKKKAEKLSREIRDIIQTNHLLDSYDIRDMHKDKITAGLTNAKTEAKKLAKWSNKELHDVLQYRVSSKIVKEGAKLASGYIFNEIKDKFDSLLQFVRREETYLFGLARHQVMLPYLRATQPQKS